MNQQLEYFIVDFNAKHKFQHNATLINDLSDFIKENGFNCTIFLPKFADKQPYLNNQSNVNFNLLSPMYGPKFTQAPIAFITFKFLRLLVKFEIGLFFRNFVRYFLVKKLVNYFVTVLKNQNRKIAIIFPTTDPLCVKLSEIILAFRNLPSIVLLFRITGVETRGDLASHKELETLSKLSQTHWNSIRFGVETNGFSTLLQSHGIHSSKIYWSPWFQRRPKEVPFLNQHQFNIGFLGTAKKRKGFEQIPYILNELRRSNIDFKALVQKASYPWDSYALTISKLSTEFNNEVEFLPADLPLNELINFIGMSQLLILPYEPTSYEKNASGLLYHAADAYVPVIAKSGVGFESEIVENNIGFIYHDVEDIPELITRVKTTNFNQYFVRYNNLRDVASYDFYLNGI